jgi:hypothetical protein
MAKIQVVCEKFTRFCGSGPPAVGRRRSKPFSEGFAEDAGEMKAASYCNGRDGAGRFPEQLSMPGWDRGNRTAFFWEEYVLLKESTFCLISASFWRDFWNAVWYNGLENVSSGKGCRKKVLPCFAGRDPAFCGALGEKLLLPPVVFRKSRAALFRGPGDSR